MAQAKTNGTTRKPERKPSLTSISVRGFKSFRDETEISIRPLTLLAGANSSGKSSAIQPLLLLKQTLEAGYDPGPLLLHGPNVKFATMDQTLWHGVRESDHAEGFQIGLQFHEAERLKLYLSKAQPAGVALERLDYSAYEVSFSLSKDMSNAALRRLFPHGFKRLAHATFDDALEKFMLLHVVQDRCALTVEAEVKVPESLPIWGFTRADPFMNFRAPIRGLIHLPGLRGNPERAYPTSQVTNRFPGVFQDYTASIIASWKDARDVRLDRVGEALRRLGLTWKIEPRRIDDTRIEIRVGRLPSPPRKGGSKDLVNIADVGLGISQTLPLVVALLAADPGQVVYLEQPEIHLHPRAQVALADLLLDAAGRGVVVIVETHSHLVVQSVQRAVASGEADPSLIALHWFERDERGATKVTTAELDRAGTYGEWPIDFADVELEAESAFLDAPRQRGAGIGSSRPFG